ncbi:MAG TPA: insulinase family protein [Cytophagaceae bacterium]|jgi:zinc protease
MKNLLFILLFLYTVLPRISAQEIVELKKPGFDIVVVKMMFKNGSITDPKGKEGLTNLVGNIISEGGTQTLTKSQIDEKIYPMAAQYSFSVDKEVSVLTFQVHKDFLDKFYAIAKDLVLAPAFSEADFNRVKSNQLNYVSQVIKASSDEEYSKKALEDFLFRGTNYQHMVEGTASSVAAISLTDVKAHYKKYFTKYNLTVGVAGDYPQDFLKRLKDDMAGLDSPKPVLPSVGKARAPKGIEVEIISKENTLGSAVFAGFPLNITRSNDEFAALMVANSWLGEHRKAYGKLYNKIRETRSMNYGDYTYIEWYENGGQNLLPQTGVPRTSNYFSLWLRPVQTAEQLKQQYPELKDIKVGHAHFAMRLAIREIDMLIKNGLTQKDFEATRDFLRSYVKLYIQTPEKELGFLMDSKFYGRKNYISELDVLLGKLDLASVNSAVKKYLQVNNLCVTVVTDDSEAAPLSQSLLSNATSPMSYSNTVKQGLPAEVLKEDEEVAKYKLNIATVKIIKNEDTFK